ncbi:transcription initiation factor IID, 31kD subunit-domain-containing protein [Collybia nuda]|uniref:Transcription initiation factor IID, 31kD subunit-domain-containing protein n=1 Tax=Collybia nuda TaxID=64659 RepID=A0A9P6CP94_9AGAR|nr:transcription initiation factor IID, 31kD subunit-domain-containing protein [Collybia nuda]
MSRPAENLPPTARAIALLLSSTPAVQDAQPGVLHQLLEFSHRYTTQVLTDASVYAEHGGRSGKIETEDVVLAVQARVGWEFGGRVPKEYILSLATQVNAAPLPAVPEVFGVRLPQPTDCLTSIDFDLVPNKPPPGVKLYDEEIEEIEESDSEEEAEDEDMEPASIPPPSTTTTTVPSLAPPVDVVMREEAPFPISAIATPSDIDMIGGSAPEPGGDDGSDAAEEEDGLFAGGDDEEEESDAMEEVPTTSEGTNGVKRKLVEEDDYD